MNYHTKQTLGIVLSILFYFIGAFLLYDFSLRIIIGIISLSFGISLVGLCIHRQDSHCTNEGIKK